MKKKALEHLFSIIAVLVFFIVVYFLFLREVKVKSTNTAELKKYLDAELIDFSDSYEKNLFLEVLNIYNPNDEENNRILVYELDEYRLNRFIDKSEKAGLEDKSLTFGKAYELIKTYSVFFIVYLIVMIIIHYLAQSFAVMRFVKIKQGRLSYLNESIAYFLEYKKPETPKDVRNQNLKRTIYSFIKGTVKTIGYIVIFSPAYVIAYSFKTSFSTDSAFFMIILAVFTNGLLINYAYKFYSLLNIESKAGYVETAIVKGLKNNYNDKMFMYKKIFKFNKKFPGHVFWHIYINAKYKNILNIKELSALLITGLIIIEMALNIQGYICYELLQNILFKQYDVVIFIVMLIFITVKLTELFVDYLYYRKTMRYENKR